MHYLTRRSLVFPYCVCSCGNGSILCEKGSHSHHPRERLERGSSLGGAAGLWHFVTDRAVRGRLYNVGMLLVASDLFLTGELQADQDQL